jgi:hypothetical protein
VAIFLPCVNRSALAFTQEVSGVRVGLGAVRSLTAEVAQAAVVERVRGGPFLGLADFRRRVSVAPQDLALLIRSGCFDYEPWPFEGLLAEYSLATQWRDEWELLGFLAYPPLMALVRAVLTPALTDSRTLAARVGKRVRLAGVVAAAKETSGERHNLTLEDEWGLIEIQSPALGEEGAPGPVLLVEGDVQGTSRRSAIGCRASGPRPASTTRPRRCCWRS